MNEYIRRIISSNESVAFGVLELLNYSFALSHSFLPSLHLLGVLANRVNGKQVPIQIVTRFIEKSMPQTKRIEGTEFGVVIYLTGEWSLD